MGRIFTGDYSTGDLSQWLRTEISGGTNPGANSWADYRQFAPEYPITVVQEDSDCGYASRHEVRPGDYTGDEQERAEVADDFRPINVTRWEAFSIKFDENFPLNVADYTNAWQVTNQWPDASGLGWGPTPNFVDGATPSGMTSLVYFQGTDRSLRLLDVPMNRGNWIDIKMECGWYNDSRGFVRVWVNGVRQTLRYGSWAAPRLVAPSLSPSDTFTGQTVWNNTSGTFYYKEGLYRNRAAVLPTGIVYHANYRTSTDEAGL
jgi:hypothetical protein